MQVGIVSTPTYATKPQDFPEERLPSDPAVAPAAWRLTRRASLMLTLLLSLGLWAAIWALASAISALVSF